MKKIRIFLGGYVNYPNAQNINCDYIAKYLSKDKFEVHTMYSSKKAIDARPMIESPPIPTAVEIP